MDRLCKHRAQRHNQRVSIKSANSLECHVQCRGILVVGRAAWQRQVEVVTEAIAGAVLFRVAPEKRVKTQRVGVYRDREYIRAIIENVLRPVSMMNVDVQYCDPRMPGPQYFRADSRIVEVAETTRDLGGRVMPGGSAQRVAGILAVH